MMVISCKVLLKFGSFSLMLVLFLVFRVIGLENRFISSILCGMFCVLCLLVFLLKCCLVVVLFIFLISLL